MRRGLTWITGLALATVGGMAACNKSAPAGDLSRDLETASSPSPITLAPTAGQRDVISAVEQSPDARRAPKPSTPRVRMVSHRAPDRAPVVTPPVTPSAVAATDASAAPEPGELQPLPQSRRPAPVQQAPRGGYKTEAEVIRNAPFPILP